MESLNAEYKTDIENLKKEYPKEYWQLVSNSWILGTKNAEAILYLPYVTELPIIADMAANWEDLSTQWRYKYISDAFLNDNIKFSYALINLHTFICLKVSS